MQKTDRPVMILSIALVALGILSLVLNFAFNLEINISWPFVLILLGTGASTVAYRLSTRWRGLDLLYIPGFGLFMLGLLFLLNILTGDWNAWAYAWMLVLAALGLGVVLVSRAHRWPMWLSLAGGGTVLGGAALAILFGAIAGGRFILVIAPLLLVTSGVSLAWLYRRKILPDGLMDWLQPAAVLPERPPAEETQRMAAPPAVPGQQQLVETLSSRELEVLALIDLGLSNSQIADKLSVATSTVKTHINNIYGKLGVQSRTQAIKQAKDLRLLD